MPDQITNYQCPRCTGPLHFSAKTGRLECEYCGSSFSVEEVEKFFAEKNKKAEEAMEKETSRKEKEAAEASGAANGAAGTASAQPRPKKEPQQKLTWDTSELQGTWGSESTGMQAYNCPSCGAELICDASTGATSCPYCGNNTIVPGQFGKAMKPDYVIPFKLDKQQAVDGLKKHYQHKPFLPREFSEGNHIEKIQGVYVPFWLFDGKADGDVCFSAEKERQFREDDNEVTETEHYNVRRAGSMEFTKIPVDASEKMPDQHMDSIEPFDYAELKPFSPAYLPGFLAERSDVAPAQDKDRVTQRCTNTMVSELRGTVSGYDRVNVTSQQVDIQPGDVHYALMPVWLLDTKWQGKDFLFAMNGQTGRMVGDLPTSKKKYWLTFLCIFVAFLAVMMAVFGVFSEPLTSDSTKYILFSAVIALIPALIICQILKSQMKSVHKASEASSYEIPGSVDIRVRQDIYLNTTRVVRKVSNAASDSGPGSNGPGPGNPGPGGPGR